MNKNIFKISLGMMIGASAALTSCNKEPDESNLYTFTGQTIEDYLQANDSIFSEFNKIMARSGYNRMMASYGQFTCYAPVNEGVLEYLDSLYNDPKAKEEHNGMTENSVEGLTDEMCRDIARYHLSANMNAYVEDLSKNDEKEVTTMLNTPFMTKLYDDGVVRFNSSAEVMSYDNEMTNGYVHVINKVIPRTTRRVNEIFEDLSEYSLFNEALILTGLADSLSITYKTNEDGSNTEYSTSNNNGRPGSSFATAQYYVPTECKIKYTIFAEDSATFAKEGIRTFADLKQKCIEWYGNADEWYPLVTRADISTGDDYTNPYNVVNMFMRYHIVKGGMSVSKLLFERDLSNESWNYAFGGEPHEYYETMLPNTMMKIWQPLYHNTGAAANIWINRWRQNNTLTDEIGTFGSEETHQILETGCQIMRAKSNIQTYNGYIHNISKPLVYTSDVPNGVLHERMRIDMGAMFPELSSNDIRFATQAQIGEKNLSGSDGNMTRLPNDYLDNLVTYSPSTQLSWYTWGAWRAFNCDQLSGWGMYDFAVRIPPLPSGTYEIRLQYPPMADGSIQQYYIGTSNNPSTMQPLGTPWDSRYPNISLEADRNATGYLTKDEFSDYGVASDLVLRTHGYMRGPACYARGTYNQVKTPVSSPEELIANISYCSRYEEGYGTMILRKILGTVEIDQTKRYWIRLKNLTEGSNLGFSLDYLEFVPIDIVNSQDFTEDWY